jgi:hypothetical protein
MAAVTDAGPPRANEPKIRRIEIADVRDCIAKGVPAA